MSRTYLRAPKKKKRNGFRTSPSIRIPRAAAEKIQSAEAEANLLRNALAEAVKLIDEITAIPAWKPRPILDPGMIKRLEACRALSIFE